MTQHPLAHTALGISVALGLALGAPVARAELRGNCTIDAGHVTCDGATPCADDTTCFTSMLGRCIPDPTSPDLGLCVPACHDLFLCNGTGDCPTLDGLTPTCRSVASLPNGLTGVCTYADASDNPIITICSGAPGTFLQCFSGGSWADGNCDGDTLLNREDSMPCAPGGSPIARPRSPFCAPATICEGTSTTCAPMLGCIEGTSGCAAVAAQIGATMSWECSPLSTSMEPFCHPVCDSTAHCETDGDCLSLGTCQTLTSGIAMCEPAAFACAGGCVGTDPLDWATFDGDCDGDGAANGCDPSPCAAGDAPCGDNRCPLPVRDAGVPAPDGGPDEDAGSAETDAGSMREDAGASAEDGGSSRMDGGATGADASSIPVTPGLVFGGGGGCRCAAAGSGSRTAHLPSLFAVLLSAAAGARTRLVRRRRASAVGQRADRPAPSTAIERASAAVARDGLRPR